MVDREDIDALLIGRLYGELSSADEARLQSHLASGTSEALADRRALEDMTHARSAVRESRLLAEQAEPPQSISALLMQEAARRAPKPADEQAGWFARFVRSFMMHPAMAAAATLVLVVGVAGALYSRKGDHFAAQQKDSAPMASAARELAPTAAAPPAEPAVAQESVDRGRQDQGMAVDLAEGGGGGAVGGMADDTIKTEKPRKAARPTGIEVTTPQAQPKDFERADDDGLAYAPAPKPTVSRSAAKPAPDVAPTEKLEAAKKKADRGGDEIDAKESKGTQSIATAAQGEAAPVAPAAPPPPPPGATAVDPDAQWARDTHKQVVAQARANRCDEAATTAESIAKRARGYYDANVQNDRDLKGCMTLIAQRREQAEAAQRAKAGKKRPEPATPAGTK